MYNSTNNNENILIKDSSSSRSMVNLKVTFKHRIFVAVGQFTIISVRIRHVYFFSALDANGVKNFINSTEKALSEIITSCKTNL